MFPLNYNSLFGLTMVNEPLKRPPVRRNLFGTPNPEKQDSDFLTQELRLAENDSRERCIERWGFDPKRGLPVEHEKFEWTEIPNKDVPSYYSKSYGPSKSRPVSGPRRERSQFSSPYSRQHISPRPLKRAHPFISRTVNDDENTCTSQVVMSEKRVMIDVESTPKALRTSPLDAPSLSSQNLDSSCSTVCSTLGCNNRSPSQSVSNNSPSSGLNNTSRSNGVLRQQTIKDHFQVQVKRPRSLNKSLPRT